MILLLGGRYVHSEGVVGTLLHHNIAEISTAGKGL